MSHEIEDQLSGLRSALDELAPPVGADEAIEGRRGPAIGASSRKVLHDQGDPTKSRRRVLTATAAALCVALGGGLWWTARADRSANIRDSTPATTADLTSTAVPITSALRQTDSTIRPANDLVEPGVTIAPGMRFLLNLPACPSADGLAAWAAGQLGWWGTLDPATFEPARFDDVTTSIPVDTADANSVTCTAALAVGDVKIWGLGDSDGNWLARGAGILDPGEFERPEQPDGRPVEGDVLGSETLGNGQIFNDFFLPTEPPRRTIAGMISFGPIITIELREPVDRREPVARSYYLRTGDPLPGPGMTSTPEIQPTLVPQGFGRCSDNYLRTAHGEPLDRSGNQSLVLAKDYCNDDNTITVTAGDAGIGQPFMVGDRQLYIDTTGGTTRISAAPDDGELVPGSDTPASVIIIAPDTLSLEQLSAMYLSITSTSQPTPSTTEPPG